MVEVERKEKKIMPTTRIVSLFILVISMVVLAFSTNKIYEYYVLTQAQDELITRKEQLIRENEEFQILLDEENYNIVTYKDGYCYNSNTKTAYKCQN